MTRTGLSALLSHWRRHPVQLLLLLAGLALATALWSGVQAINAEARASYDRAASALGQNRLDRVQRADGLPLTLADYVALRRAGWPVSPMVEGRLPGLGVRLVGIEPLTLPAGAQQGGLQGAQDLAAFLRPPGLLIANGETIQRLEGETLPPLRRDDSLPDGMALADIGIAQGLLGRGDAIDRLVLAPDWPGDPAMVVPGLMRRSAEGEADIARLTDSFHLNLTAFGFLAFAVGLFIVHSAIGLAFEQRRAMFRTLRALGLPARVLMGLMLAELMILGAVAGAAGVVLGYLVASALLPDVAATLRGLYGAEVPGTLSLRPGWWAAGLGIAQLGTLIAAGQSLWQLWRLPLLAAAQPRAWARARDRALVAQAVAGVGLLGLCLLLIGREGAGLWAGFAALAALLIGAALLLPLVLALATRAGGRLSRGVVTQWFWADTRQQVPGLSLSLMALLLALAASIGVGTMVSSFRATFTGWLDQRLASELYLTAPDAAQAARMLDWLGPQVEAILPIVRAEAVLAGRPGDVYGVADHATYRDHWPVLEALPGVWDKVAAGQGVLANEQLFRQGRMRLGDRIDLPGGALPVVGVYSDYGNPRAQVLIGLSAFDARFPEVPHLRFGLRVAPDKAAALAGELTQRFDLPPEALVDQAAIKAESLKIFERTFTVTTALNVLTLAVAGLALFASLLTLAGLRLPQLAPVWAMGLTRARLARLELIRSLALALFTFAAALPLGLALAWVLLAVVNVEAFGWRLPMRVFPGDWVRLLALALVAAGLAAALPALRLARMAPARLLGVFANER